MSETAWHGPMWNDCGSCNYVRRTEGRPFCAWCLKEYRAMATTLAHNLAIGAWLCAAWKDGYHSAALLHSVGVFEYWRPGCGKQAP